MTRRLRRICCASVVVFATATAVFPSADAQGRPLTVHELKQIFVPGGDVPGWDEFDVPEFVASAYGSRARDAVEHLLREPLTERNYYLQLEALTTARYPRVDVSAELLLEFANGTRPKSGSGILIGILRRRALTALAMRPDPALVHVWLTRIRSSDVIERQTVAAGLACSLGPAALEHLRLLEEDADSTVVRVARFYATRLRKDGDHALACGGRVSRIDAGGFPREIPQRLKERGGQFLPQVP